MRRLVLLLCCVLLAGCEERAPGLYQGYMEGEFVYVASQYAGRLQALRVARGDRIAPGDELFVLEDELEAQAVTRAEANLERTRDTVADLDKGLRKEELAQLKARHAQARAQLQLARAEHDRRISLRRGNVIAQEELDQARTTLQQAEAAVADLEAQLATGQLGSREDQRSAARAQERMAAAELEQARWQLEQKRQRALVSGTIFDLIHYPGEWVAAGSPVLSLLPPEQIKCRFFVPQTDLAGIQVRDPVAALVDGQPQPVPGWVSYISPQAEYTPPVIYSQQFRAKLVFMVEARFPPGVAATLHPGQPVDVRLQLRTTR
ncbi:HlyD family secretion protein [Megalodesulfovibrio gigas]|uniref:Putative secretion protein HlyD family protein n=1 Tax=Megalodesulfovibrio gigas (strain ATCC 19364 / DSM 1382 / NCIMB 9332 / VKM B-1759) TaxID=1121448 RepID=T2GEQ9_MEGG1|nr:HlyD family efflux transporter periplasmic adaptor subunit [Megalodesulfovibrio gigas]AGW14422.1 putative secretion protein HlyD family protein [Megalodesulfovibrio gigas DSM 1382 = ATCC 19364]